MNKKLISSICASSLLLMGSQVAQAAGTLSRVYSCTSFAHTGIHLEYYWGEDSADLKDAQQSAQAKCERFSEFYLECKVNECGSTLPDGSDFLSEPTN